MPKKSCHDEKFNFPRIALHPFQLFHFSSGPLQAVNEFKIEHLPWYLSQVCSIQAWGVLEEGVCDTEKARQLFRAASKADARMVHVWQAWGMLELRCGNFAQARKLFQSAVWCSAASSDVCRVWQVNAQPCMRTTYHSPCLIIASPIFS